MSQKFCGSLCRAGIKGISEVLSEYLADGNVSVTVKRLDPPHKPIMIGYGKVAKGIKTIEALAKKHPLHSVDIVLHPIPKVQPRAEEAQNGG
ncbi:MAG: hypothetical protein WCI57_05425 [Candidatus Berkelbacteria bacterium]